ncbi:uL30 family ribosomal protein [Candidatus Woesearchaeota archaeon]|nr:uL30 family ribosomal protein [Candidatus Woesearchaeota archaeon]
MCGCVKLRSDFEDTLRMLNMSRKFMCVVLDATPSVLGMVRKVKDYVTWGEVTPEVVITLQQKRGEKIKDREGKEVLKPFFRLHPPRGGFERKGMKVHFRQHGALGYRGTQINDLIKRMI